MEPTKPMAPDIRNARTAGREAGRAMVTATKIETGGVGRVKNPNRSEAQNNGAIRAAESNWPSAALASLPSSSSPTLDERVAWFEEQARRAYLHARARGVKWPSLAPEAYEAQSHLRYWRGVKFRRESGFTVEGER